MNAGAPAKIPSGPEEITPEWLTQALRSRGVTTESEVTSVASDVMAARRSCGDASTSAPKSVSAVRRVVLLPGVG